MPSACFSQVISARKGEFETGFERGGQTREHALLAKTLGISKMVVVVNKMDEPSVQWAQERYAYKCQNLEPEEALTASVATSGCV